MNQWLFHEENRVYSIEWVGDSFRKYYYFVVPTCKLELASKLESPDTNIKILDTFLTFPRQPLYSVPSIHCQGQ